MARLALLIVTITMTTTSIHAADKRPMSIDDLFKFQRVADPQISPDGKWAVYAVTTVIDVAGNKTQSNLWLASMDGKSRRQLTTTDKKDRHPRWSPDGKQILFESTRTGDSQLWLIDITGGEARQLTTISTGASTGIWSRDGSHVAFVSAVYPEFSEFPYTDSDAKNKAKKEAFEKNPVKAKVFNRLFYRHWDEYVEDKRQHLFVLQVDYRKVDSPSKPGEKPAWQPRDVTPGDRDAYPTSTTFSIGDDFTYSPDGSHLVFTAVPAKGEAWSTNYEICRVSIHNKSSKWETLTTGNEAADATPVFSPNGSKLAYRAQKKAGYEADKWNLMVAPCKPDGSMSGPAVNLTEGLDRSVDSYCWPEEGKLYFTCEDEAETATYQVRVRRGAETERFYFAKGQHGTLGSLTVNGIDGSAEVVAAFTIATMDAPAEVYVGRVGPEVKPKDRMTLLSHANDALLAGLDRPRPESVKVPVEGKVDMQMWILKPPGFDAKKKWPVVYLVHGGPQGAWEDGWSFRWNATLWAAQGYVVAMPNPRGSTGFGQKFVDEISGDWGGKCYRDLMTGLDYVEKLEYVDKSRIGSAGASFGGYMMNWFAVSTDRFKCLITHCSVWNFESMWGTTDELWFDEYEHGGLPWDKPGKYREFSPHTKAGNLAKYKTPMLIVHNDHDFRCPIGQGHELFSALQRLGVKSRFVNFPDEGHWVQKPANSKYWHQEVFGWLKAHVPPGGK